MRYSVLFAALLFSTPAFSAPVYLECTISGATKGFTVTLDEERGTAAHLSQTVPATFTFEEVKYRTELAGILNITQIIDRKTLGFTSVSQVRGGKPETKQGTCAIIQATQNKF